MDAVSLDISLPVSRDHLCAAQKADQTLRKCFFGVVSANNNASSEKVAYFLDEDILMHKLCSFVETDLVWSAVYQIVVPSVYRHHVLSVAHESQWSGHLGVTKTYQLILRHFFWPGLKADVVKFCRCCHAGKPNQPIPPAPLHPIPAIGEPFGRVIIDCVGPLPRTKNGNQYLLTSMRTATRFPEAVPMRKITVSLVVKVLTKFFSTFGLPRFHPD